MRVIIERVKRYWDVLGGTIIGLISSILVKWEIDKIQLIYSILILILLNTGLLKVLSSYRRKQKIYSNTKNNKKEEKRLVDKIVEKQKPFKALHYAERPTEDGEELGNLVVETINGGKNIMNWLKKLLKWIRNYWQQIVGILCNLAYYLVVVYLAVVEKLSFITERLPEGLGWEIGTYVAYGLLTLFFGYYGIRNQVVWCGLGSNKSAEEFKESLKNKANQIVSTLSSETKQRFKNMLNEAKKGLKEANNILSLTQVKYDKMLKEFDNQKEFIMALQSIGAENSTLETAQEKYTSLQLTLNELANELQKAKNDVAKYEKQIDDCEVLLNK